jgi:acyl-coenzyme A thioesterase PaaI-like protein
MDSNEQGFPEVSQGTPFDPTSHGWEPISEGCFVTLVGPIWQKPNENGMRFAYLAEPKHHNRYGIVHGGMIMTFADQALGMTARHANGNKRHATIQLDVHLVDAVHAGEFVEAWVEITRRTRSVIFVKADLVVGPRVVASANGIWKVLAGE